MSLWTDYGFRETPYATTPLPPTDEGETLLVGRDRELSELRLRLTSSTTHPTIEGMNGVGKTSLVAVAAFQCLQDFKLRRSGELLIPLPDVFQLQSGLDRAAFERSVYFSVANAIIDNYQLLSAAHLQVPLPSEVRTVKQWLSQATFTTNSAGASVAGFGAAAGRGAAANDGGGFSEAGFQFEINRWLRDMFPSEQSGGFVCVLDNLELLETSAAARAVVEGIRDSLLQRQGLRWVLCGARGIMRSCAASPRLQGVLAEPMEIGPIEHELVADVIARRIDEFALSEDAYAPVEPDGFQHLYEVANQNLRIALKYAQDFAVWMKLQEPNPPRDAGEKRQLLEAWMAITSELYSQDTPSVGQRAWGVFEGIVIRGGDISPGDFLDFEFSSQQAMRPHIRVLEEARLVESSLDESDHRRKLIGITARGWIVNYSRSGFRTPSDLRITI